VERSITHHQRRDLAMWLAGTGRPVRLALCYLIGGDNSRDQIHKRAARWRWLMPLHHNESKLTDQWWRGEVPASFICHGVFTTHFWSSTSFKWYITRRKTVVWQLNNNAVMMVTDSCHINSNDDVASSAKSCPGICFRKNVILTFVLLNVESFTCFWHQPISSLTTMNWTEQQRRTNSM